MEKNNKNIPELSQKQNIFGKWAEFFIEKYKVAYLIIIMIMIAGVVSYLQLPRELQPEVVTPFGFVVTPYPGAAPEEVESLVTEKIESRLEGLENVDEIQSYSSFGMSTVFIMFDADMDTDIIVDEITDKLRNVESELPDEADDPIIQNIRTNNTPIMIINISGDYDKVTLKDFAENIQNEMEKLSEVGEVDIIGGLEREIKIEVDPEKLALYNISMNQLSSSIRNANVNFPGGTLLLDDKNYNIRTVGEFEDVEDIGNIVVTYIDEIPLFVKDIADVKDGYKDIESYSRIGAYKKEASDTISISIRKKENGDIIKASNAIHKKIEQIKGTAYPNDLNVTVNGELSTYIEDQIGTAINNSKAGLLIVIVVLFLFIGFKEALVVSLAIPMSIFTAFIFMDGTDMTFNFISLFALILAIGMLVDNGIVIMENIDRLREQGVDAKTAAKAATNQIAPAVASATLTTIAAFFPLFLVDGIMGEFIKDIPRTVIFAIGSSFLVAMSITPAISSKWLKGKKMKDMSLKTKVLSIIFVVVLSLWAFRDPDASGLQFTKLSYIFAALFGYGVFNKLFIIPKMKNKDSLIINKYTRMLEWMISKSWRKILLIVTMVFLFISIPIALIGSGTLKVNMFSSTDQNLAYVDINLKKGSKVEDTLKITKQVEKRLLEVPEIESFISNVGITGADTVDTFAVGGGGTPNEARITINLTEMKDRERTSIEITKELREIMKDIVGADILVTELQDGPPTDAPITIKLTGANLDNLKKVSTDILGILSEVDGVVDAEKSLKEASPEIKITIDKEKAANLGLDDMTVAFGIRNAVSGIDVTKYRKNQEEIDVVLTIKEEKLDSIEDFNKIYFTNRMGEQIRFDQIASITETKSLNSIVHLDGDRVVYVKSKLKDGYNAIETMNVFKESIKDYEVPDDVNISYGGEFQDIQESFTDMLKNMVIAAMLVYIILVVQFNSLVQPLIIIFAVPLSFIGVIPGLAITGNDFGFVAFVGVVALVGIVVNDAIVLVDYINYLRNQGMEIKEAIVKTGRTRFVPVFATTITTVGGILPLTLKDEFFEPMGFALIFGLLMATVLTLVVIPSMYSIIFDDVPNSHKRRKEKRMIRKGRVGVNYEEVN